MAGESAPAPHGPAPSRGRRLGIVLGVWALLVGAAVLAATALDRPVGSGERDAAQPQAPVAVAGGSGEGLAEGLPPLTLILDRPLPAGIADLAPIRQAARLETLARRTGLARRYTELGSVLQTLGDEAGAAAAYRSALRAEGDDLSAEAGLALLEATRGDEGPARAAARLEALEAANPESAVVAFNRGWLAVYRRDGALARAAWERTIALDPGGRLARVSRALIASLGSGPGGRNP